MGFRGDFGVIISRGIENLLLLLQSRGKETVLMKNIKYTVAHPIFVFMKKHFCPHCKAALTVETAHHW